MNLLRSKKPEHRSITTIDSETFAGMMAAEFEALIGLSATMADRSQNGSTLSRGFLSQLHSESTRVEEILDQFGARNNRTWFPVRELVAASRLFSRVEYTLLHLQNATPVSHLLPIEADFVDSTGTAIATVRGILEDNAAELLGLVHKIGLPTSGESRLPAHEVSAVGGLEADRRKRHVREPGKTVVYLATAFLNLSEESRLLEIYKDVRECDYARCIPDSISEEALREIENKFHNLQSLYDTHISDSDIEDQDKNLKIMRGHVSMIFNLLETATDLTHYYERHMKVFARGLKWKLHYPVAPEALLDLLMNYSIAFAHRFIKAAQDVCRAILRMYAEQGTIDVHVPNYRGFHVRPSTLVAKIIMHYGSKVEMKLGDEVYDASRPLELFRANEQINARKRKYIAEQIMRMQVLQQVGLRTRDQFHDCLKRVWLDLIKAHQIIVYDPDFSAEELEPGDDESLAEYIKRLIAHNLALGKIDIDTDITAQFSGDRRVLEDIKLLVDFGYGEDKFGNNLVLPQKLSYLKR